MKKIYLTIAGGLFFLTASAQTNPACGNNRYHSFVFPAAPTVTLDVVYGSNMTYSGSTASLKMDVYQPQGDTEPLRALIIWAHGGSFVGGAKADMAAFCNDFAKMGYVTATMDYRLGMNGLPFPGPDSNTAGAAVMRAVHDARAAVRFFRQNARVGGNTYKIDTNNIYFGGASAGGFIALHLAYMDELSELPSYIDTTGTTVGWKTGQKGMHGGVEGLSGNPGYSSKVKAIIDLSGAIADTAWMHAGDTPVISTHSVGDATVPYGRAKIILSGFYPIQWVDGSSVVSIKANQVGIVSCWKSYPGSSHVPETSSVPIYDTTFGMIRDFLEHFTCGVALNCVNTAGVNEIASDINISIYPNPANTSATIDLTAFAGHSVNIELYDVLGRKVKNNTNIKSDQFIINRDNLPGGMYFVNIVSEGKVFSKKIIFE